MTYSKRADANQAEIVKALRDIGATVQHLHTLGHGCPDLLVGIRGVNLLLEVKDGNKPQSRQSLTDDEREWHEAWRGQVCIINSVDQAVMLVNSLTAHEDLPF